MRGVLILFGLVLACGIVTAEDLAIDTEATLVAASRVSPQYPPSALAARFQGTVVLGFVVGPDGRVEQLEVIESTHPRLGFEEAAIGAVRLWRFEPARRNGEPTSAVAAYALSFRAPAPGGGDGPFVAGVPLGSVVVGRSAVGLPSRELAARGFAPERYVGRSVWAVEIPGCGYEMCVYNREDFHLKPPGKGVFYPENRPKRVERLSSSGATGSERR